MDDEEDNYIIYGMPLPEYEDETVLRKKAARELEVRDERGRQRFHGAFTGGFSAGYFNTVGTKEGWTPSTFVSSRGKSTEHVQQNPEDFMDEEDLGEFGIATRKIHTSYKFKDSDPDKKKRKFSALESVIPGEAPLKELVKPVRDSIGIEILKKLGWRPGQGIGPRIKKQGEAVKVYGCSLPDSLEEHDPYALSYTFAPNDVNAVFYKPKDNCFGLGYTGLSKQSILGSHVDQSNPTSTKSFLKKDKKKLTISGQAFGVGAFEDDDEDIYSKDDMTQYDFSEFEVDQPSVTSGTKKGEKIINGLLEGFRLASQLSVIRKYYPPPELPPDFVPNFKKLFAKSASHSSQEKVPQIHSKSATERSFLLGEKKFQSFQLKTPATSLKVVESADKQKNDNLAFSYQKTSFKPFPNDTAKQQRYEEFLKWKDSGDISKFVFPTSMTEWEKQQELEEFHRSSILFKPLSGALSSKFESRSHLSVEHEVMDAIEKAKSEKAKKSSVVEKKLVGLKTRQNFDWYPSSLLCKRFNVPNPYPNSTPSGSSTALQSKSLFDHLKMNTSLTEKADDILESSSHTTMFDEKEPLKMNESQEKNSSLKSQELNPDIASKPEDNISENKKPSIDFFKEIFENSSSSENEDLPSEKLIKSPKSVTETSEIKSQNENTIREAPSIVVPETKTVPKKSGFGVFANLDLDVLNQKTFTKKEEKPVSNEENQPSNFIESTEDKSDSFEKSRTESTVMTDLYGPELPPNYSELSNIQSVQTPVKKHKMKHKHHHHKHKNKKKKKKKSSHKSSDDSSDYEGDINPSIILEKLKELRKKI